MLRLKHALEPGRAGFGELVEPGDGLRFGESGGVGESRAGACPELAEGAPAPHARAQAKQSPAQTVDSRLDEVVVTFFQKPHSYTTDDVVEISAHGSPAVLRHIVELALARGARLAEPGEFTMRAFLNGRLDLAQAEAVRDLIESQTLYQAKVAAQQLEGALSRRLQPVKQKLVELIAVLEAGIDFAEDDISVLPATQILQHISNVRSPLEELTRTFAYGKIVHEGLTLAIVGRPNVGKSSLFNRLVERERAIVTSTPGTTRDLVSETVALGGIPVRLVDTAGIRHALDEAESIGIRKSREALADADVVLVVLDASQPVSEEDRELLEQVRDRQAIVVENKADLTADGRRHTAGEAQTADDRRLTAAANLYKASEGAERVGCRVSCVRTSAVTGEGIAELRAEILRYMQGEGGASGESGFLTNLRQQKLVEQS